MELTALEEETFFSNDLAMQFQNIFLSSAVSYDDYE
jgi:hypothetical protein